MSEPLPFGAAIGMVGGGQLGRMMCAAAARLGFRTVVLDPDPNCPAAQTANALVAGTFDDPAALAELARRFQAVVACHGVIADPDGAVFAVEDGGPGLGTSGSGGLQSSVQDGPPWRRG